jgi:hypothetical protein
MIIMFHVRTTTDAVGWLDRQKKKAKKGSSLTDFPISDETRKRLEARGINALFPIQVHPTPLRRPLLTSLSCHNSYSPLDQRAC